MENENPPENSIPSTSTNTPLSPSPTAPTKSKLPLIISGVVALLLITAGGSYYLGTHSSKFTPPSPSTVALSSPTIAPSPTASPTKTATTDTEILHWKTYTNILSAYAVAYPPELMVKEQNAAQSQPNFPAVGPLVSFAATPDKTGFGSSIDIWVGNNPNNLSLTDYITKYIKSVPSTTKFHTITISGVEGQQASDLPGLTGGEDVFIQHNKKFYYIAFHDGPISANTDSKVIFDKFLSSFKFTD